MNGQHSSKAFDATARHVFIVDDDEMFGKALGRLLRSAGHTVETFSSGDALLARRPRPRSGVLILDAVMPGLTGPQLQAQLRAEGSNLDVYFVSAFEHEPTRKAVLLAGARDWFTKPLDGEFLLALLEHSLPPHEPD